MQPFDVVLIVAIVALVAAFLVVAFLARRGSSAASLASVRVQGLESDLLAAREAKADLERRLAVEAEKSSRIPGLERSLIEKTTQVESLVQSKAAADAQVAEKLALLSGKAEAETKLTERLDSSTQALKSAQGEMTGLQSRLATLQEALEQERKQAGEKLALINAATRKTRGISAGHQRCPHG
jgi:hypothetical protein